MFFKKKAHESHVINLAVELSKLQEEVQRLKEGVEAVCDAIDLTDKDNDRRLNLVETKLKELEK